MIAKLLIIAMLAVMHLPSGKENKRRDDDEKAFQSGLEWKISSRSMSHAISANNHANNKIPYMQNINANNKIPYMQNITYLKGELLQIEQLVGKPYNITYIDTLLVYCDRYEGKTLSVFDLKNNRFVGRFINEGQGPNDVIPLLLLIAYPQKDQLYTYQRDVATISIFDVPKFKKQKNIKIVSSTPWRPFEMKRSKDYYIGLGIFEKGRFGIYNSNGKFLYTGGSYPYKGDAMDVSKAFILYQYQFCANPEKNYFAAGCSFSDHISFYEITDREIIPLKAYYSYDTTVDYKNHLVQSDNSINNYIFAYGTSSYCYMLFSGETYKTSKNGGHYIIVFDWQGNYIKTFNVDYNVINFCVDEINNSIYATAQDENEDFIIIKLLI